MSASSAVAKPIHETCGFAGELRVPGLVTQRELAQRYGDEVGRGASELKETVAGAAREVADHVAGPSQSGSNGA